MVNASRLALCITAQGGSQGGGGEGRPPRNFSSPYKITGGTLIIFAFVLAPPPPNLATPLARIPKVVGQSHGLGVDVVGGYGAEVLLHPALDVLEEDADELVPVRPRLLVEETQGVPDLVAHYAHVVAARGRDADLTGEETSQTCLFVCLFVRFFSLPQGRDADLKAKVPVGKFLKGWVELGRRRIEELPGTFIELWSPHPLN